MYYVHTICQHLLYLTLYHWYFLIRPLPFSILSNSYRSIHVHVVAFFFFFEFQTVVIARDFRFLKELDRTEVYCTYDGFILQTLKNC